MSYFNPYPPYNPPMQDQLNQLRQPYQPYQQPQVNQPQQSGMVWVRSRQEAENYPVAPFRQRLQPGRRQHGRNAGGHDRQGKRQGS